MDKIVIVAAKRTPIGSFMGGLKDVTAAQLGVVAAKAVLDGVNGADIADMIVGNVLQAGQGMNVGRQVALGAGLPHSVPGQTVNRVCGSGLQAVMSAMQGLKSGDGQLYLAGGTESMSRAPYLLPRAREGYRLGHARALDSVLSEGLTDVFHDYHMGVTAENVAAQWGITREEQDAFALQSQTRAAAAQPEDCSRANWRAWRCRAKRGRPASTPTNTHAPARPRGWRNSGPPSRRTGRSRPATPAA